MNYFSAQIIIVAGNGAGEDAFWIQILMLAVLGFAVGVGSFFKTRSKKLPASPRGAKEQRQYYLEDIRNSQSWYYRRIKALRELRNNLLRRVRSTVRWLGVFPKALKPKAITQGRLFNFRFANKARPGERQNKPGKRTEKDLDSGMELLELNFLLGIIENTKGDDAKDVMMRKLGFNELVRRGQLYAVSGKTLKVYAIDAGNLYGKDIQCEAMKELAERTGPVSDYSFEPKEISRSSGVKETSTIRCS